MKQLNVFINMIRKLILFPLVLFSICSCVGFVYQDNLEPASYRIKVSDGEVFICPVGTPCGRLYSRAPWKLLVTYVQGPNASRNNVLLRISNICAMSDVQNEKFSEVIVINFDKTEYSGSIAFGKRIMKNPGEGNKVTIHFTLEERVKERVISSKHSFSFIVKKRSGVIVYNPFLDIT